MRKLTLLVVWVAGVFAVTLAAGGAGVARAEGALLGIILVSDGGTVSNVTTGYGSAPSTSGAQAFSIPTSSKITVHCNAVAYVETADCGADGGRAMPLAADVLFPTSTGAAITCRRADAGSYTGGVVAVAPQSGASVKCWVRPRLGTE